jgi:hypothetical protein
MSALQWRQLTLDELAVLLQQGHVQAAQAVGASTVYQVQIHDRSLVAIALPDGHAVAIEPRRFVHTNRRKNGASTEDLPPLSEGTGSTLPGS